MLNQVTSLIKQFKTVGAIVIPDWNFKVMGETAENGHKLMKFGIATHRGQTWVGFGIGTHRGQTWLAEVMHSLSAHMSSFFCKSFFGGC